MACGVAKFAQQLALRLSVPFDGVRSMGQYLYPLVNLKCAETSVYEPYPGNGLSCLQRYDLFLHDWRRYPGEHEEAWVKWAQKVYAADPSISAAVKSYRADVLTAWCPSLIQGTRPSGQLRVLIFGMGHKRQIDKLERLKKLLESTGYDYTVEVSTGVHEGSPWDQAWQETHTTLTTIFGHHFRLLGYLADDALVDAMRQCHLAALFFESGVRANNTTVWAALEAGMPLLTNLDHESPEELQHGVTVLDLFKTRSLLSQPLDTIAKAGKAAAQARSWPRLLSVLVA